VILGITPKYNLHHVLCGEKTLSEAVVEGPGGVRILAAASGIPEMAELSKGQKLLFSKRSKIWMKTSILCLSIQLRELQAMSCILIWQLGKLL